MPLKKEKKSVFHVYICVKHENFSSSDCLTVGMCLNSRFLPHTVCTSEQQQLASAVGESAVEIIKRLQRSCAAIGRHRQRHVQSPRSFTRSLSFPRVLCRRWFRHNALTSASPQHTNSKHAIYTLLSSAAFWSLCFPLKMRYGIKESRPCGRFYI